jgi:hypothetical protein
LLDDIAITSPQTQDENITQHLPDRADCHQKMNPAFPAIFIRLRKILQPHSARLKVTADTPGHYCLELAFSPKLKKALPAAWVMIGKGYVSYHFMPVYMFPKLRERLSDRLSARMQGKSCFNFKELDEPLFQELERITTEGFAMCRQAGFAPADRAV